MRPTDIVRFDWDEKVSIHAPVKDATGMPSGKDSGGEVSIHAPVKDATINLLTVRRIP